MYLPDDKARSTYQIYTRRVCNMAYNNETFRTVNKKSTEYLAKKNEEYDLLKQNDSLIYIFCTPNSCMQIFIISFLKFDIIDELSSSKKLKFS